MSARTRRGNMQVATDIWHHPGTNKIVTLVGVCHIADQAFWDDTQQLIAGLEEHGHEVHFEGALRDVPDEAMPLPDYTKVASLLGLTAQQPGLTYSRAWKRTDVTMSFLLAAADPARLAKLKTIDWDKNIESLAEHPRAPRFIHWAIRYAHYMPRSTHLAAIPRSVVLHYRNRIAARAALNTAGNVVAIWGADHIPGIGRHLAAAGYHRDYRIWRTAITKPGRQEN